VCPRTKERPYADRRWSCTVYVIIEEHTYGVLYTNVLINYGTPEIVMNPANIINKVLVKESCPIAEA